jgi:hypothetical protein
MFHLGQQLQLVQQLVQQQVLSPGQQSLQIHKNQNPNPQP